MRPKRPSATLAAPERPTRRLIAVSVMFVGLIVPGVWVGLRLLSYFCMGIGPLAVAAWLTFSLVMLWKGRYWAWISSVALFSFGLLFSAGLMVFTVPASDVELLQWYGAAAAHFAVGLVALFSLKRWLDRIAWLPSQDALARADKPAVLAALKARKR